MTTTFDLIKQQLDVYRASGKRLSQIPLKLKHEIVNLLEDHSAKSVAAKLAVSTSALWRWRQDANYFGSASEDNDNEQALSFVELPVNATDQNKDLNNHISLQLAFANGNKLDLTKQPLDLVIKLLNGLVAA